MIRVPIDDDRTFNNPDGFAMVFDRTWKQSAKTEHFADLSIDQRIEVVIESMNDHPFLQEEPEQARQSPSSEFVCLIWINQTTQAERSSSLSSKPGSKVSVSGSCESFT